MFRWKCDQINVQNRRIDEFVVYNDWLNENWLLFTEERLPSVNFF